MDTLDNLLSKIRGDNDIVGSKRNVGVELFTNRRVTKKQFRVIDTNIDTLIRLIDSVSGKECTKDVIEIGGVRLFGEDNITTWTESESPSNLPRGYFIDIYIFLDRILHENKGFKELEINHKLNLSDDEDLSFASFIREFPYIFGNGLTPTSSALATYFKSDKKYPSIIKNP